MSTNPTISLIASEGLLRKCLLDCRDHLPSNPPLVIRFTGGWVRDKLLGVQSHDIDVGLSTMTGLAFAEKLKLFMAEHGVRYKEEAHRTGVNYEIRSLNTIAANPEKSKHLETVTTKMFGLEIDFVNLRKESYTEDSRNPKMEFGTAEEDALRRDATVNALFYNLDTQKVEDFTERGLQDMEDKIIRTPLHPYQTFKDDPLRVLRLIRFACRLRYNFEESTLEAMEETSIHEALRLKISRERIWAEVGKMFTGPDPCRAAILIHKLRLYESVFADPTDPTTSKPPSPAVYSGLYRIVDQHHNLSIRLRIDENRELSWLLAAYTSYSGDERRAEAAVRNALKAADKLIKGVTSSVKNEKSINDAVTSALSEHVSRAKLGMLLHTLGPTWPSQVLYALLCDINVSDDFEAVVERYEAFMKVLEDQNLFDAAQAKPIINGGEILKALGAAKSGKFMSTAVSMVLEWQFDNPRASKEDAAQMISQKREALGLS